MKRLKTVNCLSSWVVSLLPLLVTAAIVVSAYGFYCQLIRPFVTGKDLALVTSRSVEEIKADAIADAKANTNVDQNSQKKLSRDRYNAAWDVATNAATIRFSGFLTWMDLGGLFMVLLGASLIVGACVVTSICKDATATAQHGSDTVVAGTPPRCCKRCCKPPAGLLITVLVGFVTLGMLIMLCFDYTEVYHPLLKDTLGSQAAWIGHIPIAWLQGFLDKLGQVGAIFFASVATLIVPPQGCNDPTILNTRANWIRLTLYFGTALLVADVVQANALLRWASAFADTANAKTVDGLITTLVSIRGLISTTFLASIYLSSALILSERIHDSIPSCKTTPKDRHDWLDQTGLTTATLVAQTRPILAFLLPLIAALFSGPVGDLVSRIPH